jgi:hypothetical protein
MGFGIRSPAGVHAMANERGIVEAIDACRPGSNDLDAPEMNDLARRLKEDRRVAAAFESLQRWDVKVGNAVGDVPVPEGLQTRILARLMSAESDRTVVAPEAVPAPRRVWLGIAVAASVTLVLTTAWFWSRTAPVTAENLSARVDSWRQQIDPNAWQSTGSAPGSYPVSRRVLGRRFGWQSVGQGVVVAYDLAGPGEASAVLLVVRVRLAGLPKRPPARAIWTQNRSVAAWQSGALLYVLVVDGPPARYRRLLDLRRPPLA